MKILVINSGSSSLKFQIFKNMEIIFLWQIERIWHTNATISYQHNWKEKIKITQSITNHYEALHIVLEKITNINTWILKSIQEIDAIWHRVVHGWEYFPESVIITDEVIKKIEELSDLAPLHNPANLIWIKICREIFWVQQVAVFDTSFHQCYLKIIYIHYQKNIIKNID
jgi:acetate kinase